MYNLLGEEPNPEHPGFDVLETFELDGETYGRIEIKNEKFWIHI